MSTQDMPTQHTTNTPSPAQIMLKLRKETRFNYDKMSPEQKVLYVSTYNKLSNKEKESLKAFNGLPMIRGLPYSTRLARNIRKQDAELFASPKSEEPSAPVDVTPLLNSEAPIKKEVAEQQPPEIVDSSSLVSASICLPEPTIPELGEKKIMCGNQMEEPKKSQESSEDTDAETSDDFGHGALCAIDGISDATLALLDKFETQDYDIEVIDSPDDEKISQEVVVPVYKYVTAFINDTIRFKGDDVNTNALARKAASEYDNNMHLVQQISMDDAPDALPAMKPIELGTIDLSVLPKCLPFIDGTTDVISSYKATLIKYLKASGYARFRILLCCPSAFKYTVALGFIGYCKDCERPIYEKEMRSLIEKAFSNYAEAASRALLLKDLPKEENPIKILGYTLDEINEISNMEKNRHIYYLSKLVKELINDHVDERLFTRKVKAFYMINRQQVDDIETLKCMVENNTTSEDHANLLKEKECFLQRGCMMYPCQLYNREGKKDIMDKPKDIYSLMTRQPDFKPTDNAYLLATNEHNGFMVIDLDASKTTDKKDIKSGEVLWKTLLEQLGLKEPKTYQVKSGRGRHLYFKYDKRMELSVGKKYKGENYALDVLVDSHVIGPGSFHPVACKIYQAYDNSLPILPLPESLFFVLNQTVITRLWPNNQAPASPFSYQYMPKDDVSLFWNSTEVAKKLLKYLVKEVPSEFEGYRPWAMLGWCLKACNVPFKRFLEVSRDSLPGFTSEVDCQAVWDFRLSPSMLKRVGVKYLYGMFKNLCPKLYDSVKGNPEEFKKIRLTKYPPKTLWSDHPLLSDPEKRYKNLNSTKDLAISTTQAFRNHVYRIIGGKEVAYVMYEQPNNMFRPDSITNYTFVIMNRKEMSTKFPFKYQYEEPYTVFKKKKDGEVEEITKIRNVRGSIFDDEKPMQEIHGLISHPGYDEFWVDPETDKKYINMFDKPFYTEDKLREWLATQADPAKFARIRKWMFWHFTRVICNVPGINDMSKEDANEEEFKCNDPDFTWLKNWLGNSYFRYEFRPNCSPVLIGQQGCGKTEPIRIPSEAVLGHAYHNYTKPLNKIEDNGYGSMLVNKLLVQIDEASFKDRGVEAIMNNKVTGKTENNKSMNKDVFEVDNWKKWIFTTNNKDDIPQDDGGTDKRRWVKFECNHTYLPPLKKDKDAYFKALFDESKNPDGTTDKDFGLYAAACFLDYDRDFRPNAYRPRSNQEDAKVISDPILIFVKDHIIPNWSSFMYKGSSSKGADIEKTNLVPVDLIYQEYIHWFEFNKANKEFTGIPIEKPKFREYITKALRISDMPSECRMGRQNKDDVQATKVSHKKSVCFKFRPRKEVVEIVLGRFQLTSEDEYHLCSCGCGAGVYKKDDTLYCSACVLAKGLDVSDSDIDTDRGPKYIRTIENVLAVECPDSISTGVRPPSL